MDWQTWAKGLASAAISGAVAGISLMAVDPLTFNLSGGISRLGTVMLVSGVIAAANYLKQSPIPKARE